MSLTSNTLGQAYALTVLTPIRADAEASLRAVLAGFETDGRLAGFRRTHFARWVILADFINDPSQPTEDHLVCPYLLFTATLDGELDTYLDMLCATPWAPDVWGACIGAPDPAAGAPLKAYLRHNQIDTGLFFSAYPETRVEEVHRCLEIRERTIDLAGRGQRIDSGALKQAFLDTFGAP